MSERRPWPGPISAAILCAALAGCHAAPPGAAGRDSKDRIAFSRALPRLNGEQLKATLVEVIYGPGGSSPPHQHPCPVIGYVVEGALRTQVKGEAEAIYRAGETFYEDPGALHLVSANASDREPVRFLAYFTCDQETPLVIDAPETGAAQEKQP